MCAGLRIFLEVRPSNSTIAEYNYKYLRVTVKSVAVRGVAGAAGPSSPHYRFLFNVLSFLERRVRFYSIFCRRREAKRRAGDVPWPRPHDVVLAIYHLVVLCCDA